MPLHLWNSTMRAWLSSPCNARCKYFISRSVEADFSKCRLKLLKNVGVHDATMSDWSSPSPPRVKKLYSALINFAKVTDHLQLRVTPFPLFSSARRRFLFSHTSSNKQ